MQPVTGPRLIYEFNLSFDRYQAQYKHTISIVDKLRTLNEAQEIFFENRVRMSEQDEAVREDLRPFERKDIELPRAMSPKADVEYFEIPEDSFQVIRRYIIATKGSCTPKRISLAPFRASELNMGLQSLWAPSFEWEQALYDEGEHGIYVMHNGAFKVDKCVVDYYRMPKEIHAASLADGGKYTDWNNQVINYDTALEFTGFAYRKIVDIAVLIARARYGDVSDYQIQIGKILQTQNLHTQ